MNNINQITLRPRVENEAHWNAMVEWCEENGVSISAVFNSFLPIIRDSIAHAHGTQVPILETVITIK